MADEKSKLVYSTEQTIPVKEKPDKKRPVSGVRNVQQKITVRLDRKARGGKSVTVIEGLQISQQKREELLKQFKARLGTGGTVRDNSIEIQGDHCDSLMAWLEKLGFKPKRPGGS